MYFMRGLRPASLILLALEAVGEESVARQPDGVVGSRRCVVNHILGKPRFVVGKEVEELLAPDGMLAKQRAIEVFDELAPWGARVPHTARCDGIDKGHDLIDCEVLERCRSLTLALVVASAARGGRATPYTVHMHFAHARQHHASTDARCSASRISEAGRNPRIKYMVRVTLLFSLLIPTSFRELSVESERGHRCFLRSTVQDDGPENATDRTIFHLDGYRIQFEEVPSVQRDETLRRNLSQSSIATQSIC